MAKKTKVTKTTETTNLENSMENTENAAMENAEAMFNQSSNEEPLPVEPAPTEVTKVKVQGATRGPRNAKFTLATGRDPKSGVKPLGVASATHGLIIIDAIKAMIAEGKTEATREEIMAKAIELGCREKKPTIQSDVQIFSWWRKSIVAHGWLIPAAPVEKPVAQKKIEKLAPAEEIKVDNVPGDQLPEAGSTEDNIF